VESGRVQRRLTTQLDLGSVAQVYVHPDGGHLAVGDDAQKHIHFVDLNADSWLSTVPLEGDAWAWGDVDMFAVGELRHVSLWDPLTGLEQGELGGYDNKVVDLQFHPGRRILGSNSWDGTSRFWDVAARREVLRLDGDFIRFQIDGRGIAIQQLADLELWDFTGDDFLRSLPTWSRTVAFSADGRHLAAVGNRGVELWDLAAFQRVGRLSDSRCNGALFYPNAESLLTHCEHDGISVRTLAFTPSGLEVGEPRSVAPPGPMRVEGSLMFPDNDPSLFAFSDGDSGEVWLFDAKELTEIERLRAGHAISTFAISPDGRWVAASPWKSPWVLVWDRHESATAHSLPSSNAEGFTYFVFDSSSQHLIINTLDELAQWRVGTWEKQRSIPLDGTRPSGLPLGISPQGDLLAVGDGSRWLLLLRASDLSPVAKLPRPVRELWELRFSADGRLLVGAAAEQGAYVWDLERLREQLATMDLDWQP
jgi:WD40 repeat protein